ncbi:hypothetical protein H4582DRAFT_351382 [Lactarius indigo]|nr:hypothetical protein H4582DRAFT_351382 [Lactarius indigo]
MSLVCLFCLGLIMTDRPGLYHLHISSLSLFLHSSTLHVAFFWLLGPVAPSRTLVLHATLVLCEKILQSRGSTLWGMHLSVVP